MVYFLLCAALAAAGSPRFRIAWRDAALAGLLALALVAPNLAWNAGNDFTTLQHTADNADWQGLSLNLRGLAAFLAGQFAVGGPVIFAAYLFALGRGWRSSNLRYLALMSLPILAIVSLQALISGANANWAATAHIGAVAAAAMLLDAHRRWLALGVGVNLAVTLALPVAMVFADSLRVGEGNLMLARYVGRAVVSQRAAGIARARGLDTLVARDRSFLADFFYTLRDSGLAVYAEPIAGFPPHHYAQTRALPLGEGAVLYVTRDPKGPRCAPGVPPPERVASWQPVEGFVTDAIFGFRVARACWDAIPRAPAPRG
jgi:hypothetical protein